MRFDWWKESGYIIIFSVKCLCVKEVNNSRLIIQSFSAEVSELHIGKAKGCREAGRKHNRIRTSGARQRYPKFLHSRNTAGILSTSKPALNLLRTKHGMLIPRISGRFSKMSTNRLLIVRCLNRCKNWSAKPAVVIRSRKIGNAICSVTCFTAPIADGNCGLTLSTTRKIYRSLCAAIITATEELAAQPITSEPTPLSRW